MWEVGNLASNADDGGTLTVPKVLVDESSTYGLHRLELIRFH